MTAVISAAEDKQELAKGQAERSFLEVWIITIGHSLTHWYPATFYILLPLIGAELGLSYAQIGMILTAQAAAGAIANIPGGIIVNSVARKGILMAASLFWIGVPYFAMGYTDAYWVLLACSVLIGIGNNLWHPTAIPWLGRRFPDRKGLVMAYHGMGGNVGDALAPLAAGALLTTFAWMTWRDIVIINIVPGVAMAIAILWYLGKLTAEKPGAQNKPEQQKTLGEVLKALPDLFRNKTLIFLSTSSAFRAITQGGIMAFLPLYLAKELGYNPWWVGLSMFVLQAAGFVAAPIAGPSVRQDGPAQRHHVVDDHDGGRAGHDAVCRRHLAVRDVRRAARVLPVRHPARAAGVAAGRHAQGHGRLGHRRDVRRAVHRRGDRPAGVRPHRRQMGPALDLLVPRVHDHRREHARVLHAEGATEGRGAAKAA